MWGIYEAGGPTGIVEQLAELGRGLAHQSVPLRRLLGPRRRQVLRPGPDHAAMVMAIFGGLGMGNFIDWYPEAQRIQSARSVRDAAYSIWAGGLAAIFRNSFWAASILAFFVLFPNIDRSQAEYEFGWFQDGLRLSCRPASIGMLFAAIIAIHLSTISTHLNLGALYATRDLYHHYHQPRGQRAETWSGSAAWRLADPPDRQLRPGPVDGVDHRLADLRALAAGRRHLGAVDPAGASGGASTRGPTSRAGSRTSS